MATLDRLAPPVSTPTITTWSPRRAIVAALVAAIIALLQVVQSSNFANTGQKLQQLESQRTQLSGQIQQLKADVAALSSLDRTERAARDRLGMVPAVRSQYISVDVAPPAGPLLPRPLLATPTQAQIKVDSWWQSLIKALPFR